MTATIHRTLDRLRRPTPQRDDGPPFATFRLIRGVFTVDECERLIDHARSLTFAPAGGSWPWIDQAKSDGPDWATDRFVEHAKRLNERQWNAGPILMFPQFVYLRQREGDWIPPHVDHHEPGWDEAMLMAYLADPDTYDGGELLVSGIDRPIKPPQGCVIVVPRGKLHAVAPMRSGERWTFQRLFYAPPSGYVVGSDNLVPVGP